MLYLAGFFFVVAIALIGADLAGVRAAHSAGVTGTMLLLVGLALLVAKELRLARHSH
jgi:hypothetical protein